MLERRRVHPQQLGNPWASKVVYGRHCWLHGFAVRETTGAGAATFRLHDGNDATGPNVIPVTLAAGESSRDWFGDGGISLEGGCFLEVISGTVEGTVFLSDDRGGSSVSVDLADSIIEASYE